MSRIDVADLAREELAEGRFPAESRASFRLHVAPAVRRGIEAHAKADPKVEICGVLVGHWQRDANGPFATVTDYIRCDSASSKFAEVTFTHESWADINHEMDTRYADKRIVGWYHSHPDFGIFLSERDAFIHEHFFSGPGQVAYVIDPVRDLEGAFTWQNGKPTPLSHFWIGDEIRTVDASHRNSAREVRGSTIVPDGGGSSTAPTGDDRSQSAIPLATTLLSFLALFLLGYFYAGWRTNWERERIVQGVVAHYGVNKFMKHGLEQDLAKARQTLRGIETELKKLPGADDKLSAKQAAQANEQRRLIGDSLLLVGRSLEQTQEKFALTAEERQLLAEYLVEQLAAIEQRSPAPSKVGAKKSAIKPEVKSSTLPPAGKPKQPLPPAQRPTSTKTTPTDPAD